MKTAIQSVAAALCLFLAGCKTVPQQQESVYRAVVFFAVSDHLRQHPGDRPAVEQARATLFALENATDITVADALIALHALPIRELRGERFILTVTAASILLSGVSGGVAAVEKPKELQALINGAREGVDLALTGMAGKPGVLPLAAKTNTTAGQ